MVAAGRDPNFVSYLLGVAKVRDRVFILMDLEGVLSAEDVIQLSQLSANDAEAN